MWDHDGISYNWSNSSEWILYDCQNAVSSDSSVNILDSNQCNWGWGSFAWMFLCVEAAWMTWHWLFQQLACCILFVQGAVSKVSSSWKKLTQAENPSFKNNVNLWWKHHGKEVQWESLTVFPSTRALTNEMAWQELSVSGVLRCELRGQHLHLQQCELPMNTGQMNGSEIYRSFLGTNDEVSIFLQETSTTESSHKNGILISSQLPAPIATSLVIDGLLTQSSAFSPFQLITAILWPFIHLEKGWQWTWLGICCCWLLWWWWWWWWLRNVGNFFFKFSYSSMWLMESCQIA